MNSRNGTAHFGIQVGSSSKDLTQFLGDPAVPPLDIYTGEIKTYSHKNGGT